MPHAQVLSHPGLLGVLGFSTDSPRRPGQTGVPYTVSQQWGKQMPEKPHMAEGHYLVTSQVGCFLLCSNPRQGSDWLTLGQSEMAGWSHGTDLVAGGCSQRMGKPLRWTVHPRSFCTLQASVSSWLPLTTSLMCLLASVSPPLLTVERTLTCPNFDQS